MIGPQLRRFAGPLMWTLSCVAGIAVAERVEVVDELSRLAVLHGFELTGLEHVQEGSARAEAGDLHRRLRTLLGEYDYVIVAADDGGVGRVIILGEKAGWTPPPPVKTGDADAEEADEGEGDIVLQTTRKGSQLAVKIGLEDDAGERMERSLLVDTGAEYLVLPRSLLADLGIDSAGLRDQTVQTANGKVTAKLGQLKAVWLGQTRVADVEAAFIEDEALGGNALLGMNVLGRYRLTIDDEQNELRLLGR